MWCMAATQNFVTATWSNLCCLLPLRAFTFSVLSFCPFCCHTVAAPLPHCYRTAWIKLHCNDDSCPSQVVVEYLFSSFFCIQIHVYGLHVTFFFFKGERCSRVDLNLKPSAYQQCFYICFCYVQSQIDSTLVIHWIDGTDRAIVQSAWLTLQKHRKCSEQSCSVQRVYCKHTHNWT